MMLAADLPEGVPPGMVTWLACLAFLLWIWNQGREAFGRKEPQPANESLGIRLRRVEDDTTELGRKLEAASKQNEIHASQRSSAIYKQIEELRKELQAQLAEREQASQESRNQLHERINPLVENTSAMLGKMEAFTKSFEQFTALIVAMQKDGKK